MKTGQIILLALGIVAAGLALWFLYPSAEATVDPQPPAPTLLWWVEASSPVLIGDLDDPFVYAGGGAVRPLDGSALLRYDADGTTGNLNASIALDGTATVLAESIDPSATLELSSDLREADVVNQAIHGETGRGDVRLPGVRALLSGIADLQISIDGTLPGVTYRGMWSLAEALRRDDGAIRNQGLVFSPLLRDDRVFADPSRLELTLLAYQVGPSPQSDSVVLHVVYRDVRVLAAPEGTDAPSTTAPEG